MKLKKVLSVALVAVMTMSMAACGGSNNAADNGGYVCESIRGRPEKI